MEHANFDLIYVNRLIDGDEAVERHFTAYFNELLGIKLRGRVRSHQLIDDVRQETFLRVIRNLRATGIDYPERLGAYVNTVCNNVLFEFFRSESRFREMPDDGLSMIDPKAAADQDFLSAERREQVQCVLRELPEKDRALLTDVFLNERDKDEVCREYDVDRGYLRVLLYRARLRFRAVFSDSFIKAPAR